MKHAAAIRDVAVSPSGEMLLTGCADGTAQRWDAKSCQPVGEPFVQPDEVLAVAFTPVGERVISGGDRFKPARLWDMNTGRLVGELSPLKENSPVTFSPDGALALAAGSGENSVRLWDAGTGEPVGEPLATGRRLGRRFQPGRHTFRHRG